MKNKINGMQSLMENKVKFNIQKRIGVMVSTNRGKKRLLMIVLF